MKHKHSKLIQAWLDDNSLEFEFAYGTGVDFTWHDCEVSFLVDNPNIQARIKSEPKKEKRWIRIARGGLALDSMALFESEEMARDRFNHQVVSIEVEV